MRSWTGPVLGTVLLVLVAGCARTRPCTIIPVQLELARHDRDRIKDQVEAKQAAVKTSRDNLDLARARLQQMEEQRADLEKALASEKADSAASRRKP